jgi:hypothetical protein
VSVVELVAEKMECTKHLVKKGQIVVGKEDDETGFGVFGDHERGCLDIDCVEEGIVLGFGVNPVEDFGHLCVVNFVVVVVTNEVKYGAYGVTVFFIAIIRNRGDVKIVHYAK